MNISYEIPLRINDICFLTCFSLKYNYTFKSIYFSKWLFIIRIWIVMSFWFVVDFCLECNFLIYYSWNQMKIIVTKCFMCQEFSIKIKWKTILECWIHEEMKYILQWVNRALSKIIINITRAKNKRIKGHNRDFPIKETIYIFMCSVTLGCVWMWP